MKTLDTQEIRFLKYVKTKFLLLHLLVAKGEKFNELQKKGFIHISMDVIKVQFLQNGINDIKALIEKGCIDFEILKNEKGFNMYYYRCTADITPDFSIIYENLENPIHKAMLNNLKKCSIEGDSTPYFETFLKSEYKDCFLRVDKFAGRVHTPITSLKRHMRANLLIEGEPVSKLDVVQMQPMLLAEILHKNIGENEFTNQLRNGLDIYNFIKDKMNLQDRAEAKEKFFEITFGRPSESLQNTFGNKSWIQWINTIKNTTISENERAKTKGNYNNIAWLLQNSEVNAMSKVWRALVNNDIPFLTVHDEIIVKESDSYKANKIFVRTINKTLPFAKITVEPKLPTWKVIYRKNF